MMYEVYVNGKMVVGVLSIEENEDLENNVIIIDCEEV